MSFALGRLARRLALAPALVATPRVRAITSAATRAAPGVQRLTGQVAAFAEAATDVGPHRRRRRVWSRAGRAHVEVRGLAARGPAQRRLAGAVTSTLTRLPGVRRAEVNAITGQVLIDFDEDRATAASLAAAVESVERAHGTDTQPFEWSPPHPADDAPLLAAGGTLAADALGIVIAVSARLARVPPIPAVLQVPVVLAEAEPRLRETVTSLLGPPGGELVLGTARAITHSLAHGASPMALDAVARVIQIGELRSGRAAWAAQEAMLHPAGRPLPAERHEELPRPVPLPPGPVEKAATRTVAAGMAGAGVVLGWTRDLGGAASAVLATEPKAARLGREAFAGTLGAELARQGVVPLDATAIRRLDRVTAVIIDSAALLATQPRLLAADGCDPAAIVSEWQAAQRILATHTVADLTGPGPWGSGPWRLRRTTRAGHVADAIAGPAGLAMDLATAGNRRRGGFLAGSQLDPHAEALLRAARASAERVVLTEHASTAELAGWADEVLPQDKSVAGWVRKLQQDGHGVLVLSAREAEALAAADVGVAVMTRADGVAWQADLIGTGLADGWRVLQAVGAARQASRRAAQLSAGGSGLGALLTTTRTQRRGRARVAPVHSAALAAMISGLTGARAVARAPGPAPIPRGDWHAMEPDAVLARLRADRAPPDGQDDSPSASVSASAPPETTGPAFWGLPATLGRGKAVIGAAARQKAVASVVTGPASGLAELAGAVRHELQDPLTPVLAFGAMASAAVSSGVDAALVAGVMAGNALISGVERMRAERSLGRLLREERLTGRRLAGDPGGPGGVPAANDLTGLATGPSVTVPASELRPGDIIALAPPDLVPADARLLTADDLELDESPLTGESLPVGKTTSPVPGAPLTERACMVYQGSTVLAGRGLAVVTASGEATEAGQAAMAAGRGTRPTGIQAHLAELTRISVPASGLGGLAVTGLGLLHRVPLREAIASGIAVAVAAVPEGLPLVATAAQLAAARRLTRTGVLVRSSRALEALGRVDVICFDKTGTLTQGRLAVTKLAAPDRTASPGPAHGRHLLQVGARACPQWDGDGALAHATDRAVLEAARERAGGDRDWEPAEELPFEASRGYSASLGRSAGRAQLAVKGAPEVVLPRCNRIALAGHAAETASAPMTPARRRAAQAVLHELTSQGLRVLAVAETSLPGAPGSYHLGGNGNGRAAPGDPDELATGLTLTGFLGIADTVRPSALATVRALAGAGVRVTMITGDHPGTAMAIARQLGIPHPGRVLTGPEFSRLPEDARIRRIADAAVIARVSPEQKVRIVQALQQAGHVVAMTGDGVNDAAAIRLADVGIGVTTRGSAPARSAADLVLTDSDTSHILEALAEGRTLWDRVRDAVSILVGGNAGEVAFTLLGTAASGRSPLNTRQLLLVNTLTDMLPALAVALSPASASRTGDTSALLAAGPVAPFLGPDLGRALAVRGGATALGATMAWQAGRFTGRRRRASTMGLATLVLTQLGQTLLTGERGPLTLATSAASAGVLAAIVETPGVSQFFGCSPLGPVAWTIVTGSTATGVLAAALAPRVFPATPVHPPPAPAHPDRE